MRTGNLPAAGLRLSAIPRHDDARDSGGGRNVRELFAPGLFAHGTGRQGHGKVMAAQRHRGAAAARRGNVRVATEVSTAKAQVDRRQGHRCRGEKNWPTICARGRQQPHQRGKMISPREPWRGAAADLAARSAGPGLDYDRAPRSSNDQTAAGPDIVTAKVQPLRVNCRARPALCLHAGVADRRRPA